MQYEQIFSNLIYEYFVMRFNFQSYKEGDTLPTIETLCREFNVSPPVVKSVFKRLRIEGYISSGRGQTTKVIFHQNREEHEMYVQQFFLERSKIIPDLLQSIELIYTPLLVEGICRMEEDELIYVFKLAKQLTSDSLIRFHCLILQKLDMPLILNLFWEVTIFEGVLPLHNYEKDASSFDTKLIHQILHEILFYGRKRDRARIQNAFYSYHNKIVKPFFVRHFNVTSESCEQRTFIWRIYRERPQVCYSLATRFLHQILMGEYHDVEFLPSYRVLSKTMNIPMKTITRTVKLLQKLGIAQPLKGKGIRIASGKVICKSDFADPAIMRNLSYCIQAYEIFSYTCENVALYTFSCISEHKIKLLTTQLEKNLQTDDCRRSFLYCLLFLSEYCPLKVIQEIYQKIYGLFLWSCPLEVSHDFKQNFEHTQTQFTQTMVQWLKQKNANECAKILKQYAKHVLPIAQNYLLQLGIQPEKLHATPSIHLIPIEYPVDKIKH